MSDVEFLRSDELYRAIGRVVYESALVDEVLRESIAEIGTDGDTYWWLFEGQTTEWLMDSAITLIDHCDPWNRIWTASVHDAYKSRINEMKSFRPLRNAITHGVWSNFSDELTMPRPWGEDAAAAATDVLFCSRSRPRRTFESRQFTIGDIDALADKIRQSRSRFVDVVRAMSRSRAGERAVSPLPRW